MKIIYLAGIGIGCFLIAGSGITGGVIGLASSNLKSVIGSVVILVSLVLLLRDEIDASLGRDNENQREYDALCKLLSNEEDRSLEEFLKQAFKEEYQRVFAKRALDKVSLEEVRTLLNYPMSVREACVFDGIPLEEAKKIFDESNEKVKRGEWVPLYEFDAVEIANPVFAPGKSVCRYWGPKRYESESLTQLNKLYSAGKIGKTHELQQESETHLEELIREFTSGKKTHIVRHRHWEIPYMYYHQEDQ